MKETEILIILQKGILAPSADNLQPWKFRIGGGKIDVFLDRERVKSFCDVDYLVPYLSAGAVIENMRVAAGGLGLQLAPSYFPRSNDPLWVASLTFFPEQWRRHPHEQALELRQTNRRFYQPWRSLNPSLLEKFKSLVPEQKGFRLSWIDRKQASYSKLCDLVGRADQIRFENQRLYRELVAILRLNEEKTRNTGDGLDIRTLGGGTPASFLFRIMTSWQRLKVLNMLGLSRMLNLYARMQMLSASAAGLLFAPTQKPEDYVLGGEIMEGVWHEMASQGLAIQPMEAIPIFILNLQRNGGRDFTPAQRTEMEEIKRNFFATFDIHDQNGLILLFRVGYAPAVNIRSRRRPVESFLEHTDEDAGL